MRATLDEYRGTFFPLTVQRLSDSILGSYADVSVAQIAEAIGKESGASEKELQQIQSELKEFQKMQNHFTEMESALERSAGQIDELSDRYGQTDPDDLIQPFQSEADASEVETPEIETEPTT